MSEGGIATDALSLCGWEDYWSYNLTSGACTRIATLQTAIHTTRGADPSVSSDQLRLTGRRSLPYFAVPALPASYTVTGRSHNTIETFELRHKWDQLLAYLGSTIDLSAFNAWPTFGAEDGMRLMISAKMLELARTTCNRDFYIILEAPSYGFDWEKMLRLIEEDATAYSYFAANCAPSLTRLGNTITVTPVGWVRGTPLPRRDGDDGVSYEPNSTSANSPWLEMRVLIGNPMPRDRPCMAPRERCVCDAAYWSPINVPPGFTLSDPDGCASYTFTWSKMYSGTLRAGIAYHSAAPGSPAFGALDTVMRMARSISTGMMPWMQLSGQIQLIDQVMAQPLADPTSWLGAYKRAQYEKWDHMLGAFEVCRQAGVVQMHPNTIPYLGAYIFGHMVPALMGLSANIGAASNDFFMSVLGFDCFTYYWGWRGASAQDQRTVGNVSFANVSVHDFWRVHLVRVTEVYAEEARRLRLVCGDKNATVTSSLLSVNEWIHLRSSQRRRRLSKATDDEATLDDYARARRVKQEVPRMSDEDALAFARRTDPRRPVNTDEHGVSPDALRWSAN